MKGRVELTPAVARPGSDVQREADPQPREVAHHCPVIRRQGVFLPPGV